MHEQIGCLGLVEAGLDGASLHEAPNYLSIALVPAGLTVVECASDLDSLGRSGSLRDELGVGFDDGFRRIPSLELDGAILPSEARKIVDEISRRLDMMSGAESAELWSEAAA